MMGRTLVFKFPDKTCTIITNSNRTELINISISTRMSVFCFVLKFTLCLKITQYHDIDFINIEVSKNYVFCDSSYRHNYQFFFLCMAFVQVKLDSCEYNMMLTATIFVVKKLISWNLIMRFLVCFNLIL